ncbi:MAG TPA: SMP-30/gluconolactonase/LRE family protein [Pseudonocardiaceae bacterium]|nr:SMP-30/gluconolactonase/LRE family protein [Pseudonocardiaceae bacterium]
MTQPSDVDQVTDPIAAHGEGPVWFAGWPGLRWVDMLVGDVLELSADGVRRTHVGTVAAALRPIDGGGVVLALERGFVLASDDLTDVTPLGELWSDPGVRMNEGGCDPDGRFYCGSMAYDERPGAGVLYRLAGDGTVVPVLRDVTISNGLAWSPDGGTAYYVDTPTHRIDGFSYVDGELTDRRPVVHIPADAGSPDGLTVDTAGRLWVALWGGAAVHCYEPDGRLVERLRVPATNVTACTFGGPDLGALFITTSQQNVDRAAEPAAGALFQARPGATGQPTLPYRR